MSLQQLLGWFVVIILVVVFVVLVQQVMLGA